MDEKLYVRLSEQTGEDDKIISNLFLVIVIYLFLQGALNSAM